MIFLPVSFKAPFPTTNPSILSWRTKFAGYTCRFGIIGAFPGGPPKGGLILFIILLGSKGPLINWPGGAPGGWPNRDPLGPCPPGPLGGGPLTFGGRVLWDIRGGGILLRIAFWVWKLNWQEFFRIITRSNVHNFYWPQYFLPRH